MSASHNTHEHTAMFSRLGERAAPPTIARLMTMALETPGLLSLAAGFTDNATLPVDFVGEAWRALCADAVASNNEFLQYGTNQGRAILRRLIAERISRADRLGSDGSLSEREVFITNGSQQALYLAMQVLCDPGDVVLVDRPSYFVFLEMLRGLGIEARSLPIDAGNRIDTVALGKLLDDLREEGRRVRAVYFVSYFCNPSARCLDESEKNGIAETLAARGMFIPVIEDAAYRELYFENEYSARSVLALPAWKPFPKLYTATLTKPFATGLKVGYGACTDEAWRGRMLHVKGHHDFGSANFGQAIMEHALAGKNYERQLARLRPAYQAKMLALHGALAGAGLRERGWKWVEPAGGLYIWLEAPRGLDTGMDSAFCRACIEAGVLYVPGDLCFGDSPEKNFIRLSFGVLGTADLAEAARRFASVAKQF
ncbi:2-aminoadipate transaminase [Ereboglobus sp. PH5-10]|uniref:aminotransferase-like domain-containing protein n=1 Tax=Ereboglobus sp. PH5-10 TaxID=2940629 RepID=UPI002404C4D3|nr:PLP-dependent aminotransferase family protein [Ereboglobus sp. PH5-10]MDF9826696.1 2-aminoadipate transaminase [Ereboglobus sp. PH5-10]